MCGIAFAKRINGQNVNELIMRTYFKQKSRGSNGFGFIDIVHGKHYRTKYEHQILHFLKHNRSTDILFHHRRPTSSPNCEEANHPISTGVNFENKYYLVHNGAISNSQSLYHQHLNRYGLVYSTVVYMDQGRPVFTDSESLLMELALYLEGKKKDIDAVGGMAFILLKTDKDNKPLAIYFGRNNGSPLKMSAEKNELILSSEGDGDDVETNQLYELPYSDNQIIKRPLTFARSEYNQGSGYGGFPRQQQQNLLPPHAPKTVDQIVDGIMNEPTASLGDAFDDDDELDINQPLTDLTEEQLLKTRNRIISDISIAKETLSSATEDGEKKRIADEISTLEMYAELIDDEILDRSGMQENKELAHA